MLETQLPFTGKDGREYHFEKLTLKDLMKFTRWVQFKPYRDAVDACIPEPELSQIREECKKGFVKEKVAPEDREEDETLTDEELLEKEFPIAIDSTIVNRVAFTYEGFCRLMEISLEKQNLNPDDILDDEIIAKNSSDFLVHIGLLSKKEKDKNPQNPNQE